MSDRTGSLPGGARGDCRASRPAGRGTGVLRAGRGAVRSARRRLLPQAHAGQTGSAYTVNADPAASRPYVFLSYASAEQDRALVIAAALQQAGIAVWLDRH